jgi:hypothetical protein
MGIRPFRLAISGAAVALIVCAGWFISTDQRSEINRRAFAARNESLLAQRAAQNQMSVNEMRRVAPRLVCRRGRLFHAKAEIKSRRVMKALG